MIIHYFAPILTLDDIIDTFDMVISAVYVLFLFVICTNIEQYFVTLTLSYFDKLRALWEN